ncbi:MAG: hypothetical protein ACKOX1_06000, partial [Ignavibacteria bacterium]
MSDSIPQYRNFDYPGYFKTKKQWMKQYRKVRRNERPHAKTTLKDDVQLNLYRLEQTDKYEPTNRTRAYWRFIEIFVRNANRQIYIQKNDDKSGWVTINQMLSDNEIIAHINQKKIIGIKSTEKTQFIIIDLDYHGKNKKIFLEQARILLEEFHEKEIWHYQVQDQNVNGIHFINVYPQDFILEKKIAKIRSQLTNLNEKNLELASEAKNNGMKDLANLEIYPQQNANGIRLPLAYGRRMLIDCHLELELRKNKKVQNIEHYIKWLDDKNRKWMSKEQILNYLDYHSYESSKKEFETLEETHHSNHSWKNHLRTNLHDFWIKGKFNGKQLNEHILVLCRLAAAKGYSEESMT